MNLLSHLRIAAALALGAAAFTAAATSLDIDGLPTGRPNGGGTIPSVNRLSNAFLAQGVLVSSNAGYAAVVIDGGSGTDWARNMAGVRQGLGGSNSSGFLDYTAPISFTFVSPADGTTPYVTDAFSLYTDWFGDGTVAGITAYDLAGNVVAHDVHAENSSPSDFGTRYAVSGSGIHSVVFQGSGSQAISNIQFNSPRPVPEPAPLAALGLGAIALLRRRRGGLPEA